MNCSTCAGPLPIDARACPNCGTFTPLYYSRSEASPYGSTVASSPEPGQPPKPATNYGSDASPTPPAYYAANPYEVTPPPPPSPAPKQGSPRRIIVGVLVGLVVLLLLASLIAALRPLTNPSRLAQAQSPSGSANLAATATAMALRNPYPPYTGTLVLNDPLRDNSAGYQWNEGKQTGNATCGFSDGAYHMSLSQKGYDYCGPQAKGLVFSNLAFEANLTIVQGDYAGIWFRFDKTQKTRYLFVVAPASQGWGSIFATDNNDAVTRLRSDRPVALRPGPQTNLLGVVAIDDTISLYVNHQFIASVKDASYQQGQIGIFAQGITGGFDVIASDVRVWKL